MPHESDDMHYMTGVGGWGKGGGRGIKTERQEEWVSDRNTHEMAKGRGSGIRQGNRSGYQAVTT